jgi:hypothetical protein
MKYYFIIMVLLQSQLALAINPDIAALRKLYYKAPTNKSDEETFLKTMEQLQIGKNPLLLCYKGVALILQANYCFNPYDKWSCFRKGKALMELAVEADPENIEIRFMRFCVQTNAPVFLNYHAELFVDKTKILKAWNTIPDNDLKDKIKSFILKSNCCTNNEKSNLL